MESETNWFDVAISLEEEGETFYRSLSERSESEGFQRIFTMLAIDELKHKKRFQNMEKNLPIDDDAPSTTIEEVKSIFKQSKQDQILSEQKHRDAYKQALDVEQKSIDFYREKIDSVQDETHKKALEKIIGEEQSHYQLVETIVVMVDRPESWVEDPEFGLREDY